MHPDICGWCKNQHKERWHTETKESLLWATVNGKLKDCHKEQAVGKLIADGGPRAD